MQRFQAGPADEGVGPEELGLDRLRPFTRRSDCTTIGEVPVPGCFICMMWVKDVVALRAAGMYREYLSRQVSPGSHPKYEEPSRQPVTSWRRGSGLVSRSTVCIVRRRFSPSARM